MQHYLLIFYSLFFSTGFMGGAALFILGLRVRSRLIRPLLAFQLLFLLALGIVVIYFYLLTLPDGMSTGLSLFLITAVNVLNALIYVVSIVLIRRISPPASRRKGFLAVPEIFAALVIAKTLVNLVLTLLVSTGYSGGLLTVEGSEAWSLTGYILAGLALAAFGVVARGPLAPGEPPALRPLIRGYGLCALVFAPMGLIEYAVQAAGIPDLPYVSLDHLFYLSWNLVSMSAAIRIFKPGEAGVPVMDSVPEERVRALGLSAREVEMSIMIARGLANKEIAGELGISPATVRTHIYNLYQKVGARSRVELLNKLRS